MKLIPNGWRELRPLGCTVSGTPFLPFKVPLKDGICSRGLAEREWFTPNILLSTQPKLKLIIDLTKTTRYYDKSMFTKHGVRYAKLACEGRGVLPPPSIIQQFYSLVDEFMSCSENVDSGAVIGVHCTHGLNRTGYLICKYMITKMGFQPGEAIELFQNARGHAIERDLYISDILRGPSALITRNIPVRDIVPELRQPPSDKYRRHRPSRPYNWRDRPRYYSRIGDFNRSPQNSRFNREGDFRRLETFTIPPPDDAGRVTLDSRAALRHVDSRTYAIPRRRRENYKYQGRY